MPERSSPTSLPLYHYGLWNRKQKSIFVMSCCGRSRGLVQRLQFIFPFFPSGLLMSENIEFPGPQVDAFKCQQQQKKLTFHQLGTKGFGIFVCKLRRSTNLIFD